MHRRTLLTGAVAGLVPRLAQADSPDVIGFTPDPAFVARAEALLRRSRAVDTHAHPGRTFARGVTMDPSTAAAFQGEPPFEDRAVADLKAGLVSAASFAIVADGSVLGMTPTGIKVVRDLKPGEALAVYQTQIAHLQAAAKATGLKTLLSPADLRPLQPGRDVGAIYTVEGGDFLEDDPGRLTTAFADGVRIITLVHYRPNALADNLTSPPSHGGLTPLGVEVVRGMARLGMVIDVAHAAETSVAGVLKAATGPVMCSHTHIKTAALDHPRFITPGMAREIARAGGVIGSWPSGIGATRLSDYVDRIFQLTEVVGADHVALGTDMDANFKPVLTSYRQIPLVVSELLRRGYGEANVEKLVGGNFTRLWADVWAGRQV